MTDAEIVTMATEFRKGLLGRQRPKGMCFVVCAPLSSYLALSGVENEVVESDLGWCNHVWIRLADGRVLDPTADQFNGKTDQVMPAVYLGPPTDLHPEPAQPPREEND